MSSEKSFFNEHIAALHALTLLYKYVKKNDAFMEAGYLLRAEYVLIVSAFDNYLHNIVRRKIRESFFGGIEMPSKLILPARIYQLIHNESNEIAQQEILDVGLKEVLEKDSYQSPRSVEYALNLINVSNVWIKVSSGMGNTPKHVKEQLALIVKRRNQIAHEADMDFSTGYSRNIDEQTVFECRGFLDKLVTCIDSLIGV